MLETRCLIAHRLEQFGGSSGNHFYPFGCSYQTQQVNQETEIAGSMTRNDSR